MTQNIKDIYEIVAGVLFIVFLISFVILGDVRLGIMMLLFAVEYNFTRLRNN